MNLIAVTGSRLYGYASPNSDVDIKCVCKAPLTTLLNPLGHTKMKTLKKIEIGNLTCEYTFYEFSELIKKLWEADLNVWELMASHKIIKQDEEMEIFRKVFLSDFLRPDLLRHRTLKFAEYHMREAIDKKLGKKAIHALNALWLASGIISGYSEPIRLIDSARLREYRNDFENLIDAAKRDYEILVNALESLDLPEDKKELTQDDLDYIAATYKYTYK